MVAPVKERTEPVPPVVVTVVDTGNGTKMPPNGTIAVTPDSQPNLVVVVVTPLMALLIRFVNVYIGMLVGLLGTAMTSSAITAPDFGHLVLKCASLAIGGAVVLSLKDVITVLGGLERKYPLLTGSV